MPKPNSPPIRSRRPLLAVVGGLVAASLIAAMLAWPTLQLDICYEDWSAQEFGDHAKLERRKRWSFLPGPDAYEVTITMKRFQELRLECLGGEFSGPGLSARTSGDTGPNPLSFSYEPGDTIYLSERLADELRAEYGIDRDRDGNLESFPK